MGPRDRRCAASGGDGAVGGEGVPAVRNRLPAEYWVPAFAGMTVRGWEEWCPAHHAKATDLMEYWVRAVAGMTAGGWADLSPRDGGVVRFSYGRRSGAGCTE